MDAISTRHVASKRMACVLLVIALLTVVASSVLSVLYGRGGEGRFSPDTLRSEVRSECLIIGTRIPLYRSPFQESDYPLVDYLIEKGYWSRRDDGVERWVRSFHCNRQWRDGEALWYRAIAWNPQRWIAWTEQHPDMAAVLWPRVLDNLRTRDGVEVHELMLYAESSSSLPDFLEMSETLDQSDARDELEHD